MQAKVSKLDRKLSAVARAAARSAARLEQRAKLGGGAIGGVEPAH